MSTDLMPDAADGNAAPAALTAEVRHVGGICVLRLVGSLRIATLGVVQRELDRLGRMPCRRVVLDLGSVGELDAAGARLLTGLHHYVAGRGGQLRVVGVGAGISGALDGTALSGA